jgi:hypothetical protein
VCSLVAGFGLDAVADSGVDLSSCILVRCANARACSTACLIPLQRDGPNVYMTLHLHQVDLRTSPRMHSIHGPMPSGVVGDYVEWDSEQPLHVPSGWRIADGDADDIRVCGAHPWQSWWLVFANGDSCGTAMCNMSSCIGACPLSCHRGSPAGKRSF